MKNNFSILLLLLISFSALSQQKEKIKGSKIVTVEQKEIAEFSSLEINDNLEIFLIRGDKCSLEIEADDNLHDAIDIYLNGSTLRLSATKQVTSSKKFSVRVTYTDDLKMITSKNEANVTALSEINVNDFTFKNHDAAKVFANVNVKKFTLMSDDKSKTELNLKSEETTIELSKNSQLKALISTPLMKFDMYQKSNATIEGDVIDLKLRLDNNASFTGKSFTSRNAEITVEGYTDCSINVSVKVIIDATGKSEIQLYGDQKIEMKRFTDSAILRKKSSK